MMFAAGGHDRNRLIDFVLCNHESRELTEEHR